MAIIVHVLNFYSSSITIFSGDYTDFERGWYSIVGGAMMMNLVMNSVVPSAINVGVEIVNRMKRCICCRRSIKHQAELLELYTSKPFDISTRYAQLLTTVFCTLLYSPG